jgi:hypothetical protein
MAFLAPLAFLGLLIAIPIILLYMLRLRRREVVISSTYLWQQVLEDREANTPWQRLRRNALMLLQLLILALMVLALARPFMTVPAYTAGRTALLLDASASMNATDPGDFTRFAGAQARALEIISTLGADNAMSIIRVADQPEVLAPYTTDHDQLRQAVTGATPGTGSADWLAGLTLASAGGAGTDDFTVVIISDGGLGDADGLPAISIPGQVRFLQVGESSENLAVGALATRALPGQPPQLFAQITNYGSVEAEVIFSLRVGGAFAPLVSERYTVPAGGTLPVVSTTGLADLDGTLAASIVPSVNSAARDYLPDDNIAWTVAQSAVSRSVLLFSQGNLFLEQVLASMPGVSVVRSEPGRPVPVQPYDLYVFDGVLPAALPDGDVWFINPPATNELFTAGPEIIIPGQLRANTGDPRMAFVDLDSVNVLKYRQLSGMGWATTLADIDGSPLIAAGENAGRQIAVMAFDLRDSDFPLQIGFPVLVANLLDWFTPGAILATTGSFNVGGAVTFNPPLNTDTVRVTLPDGRVSDLPVERSTLIFTDTHRPGLYDVEALAAGEIIASQTFAVNLFEPGESDITPREVTLGGTAVSADLTEELGQVEFWNLFALLALGLLMIEWWAYFRRLRVPTLGSAVTRRRARLTPAR